MDSSSDNDEFYECDDDLNEDEKINTHTKKIEKDHKQIIPAVQQTIDLDNSPKNTTTSVTNSNLSKQTPEDNKNNISKGIYNNNLQGNNEKQDNVLDIKVTSVLPTNLTNTEKVRVEEVKNNNSDIDTSINQQVTSIVESEKLDNDKNTAVNKASKSLDEFCNIREKSVDEKCQIKEKSTENVEKILEDDNDNSAVNKLSKSLDEFCNIKEKSVDEKCQIKEKSTVNVEKIVEDDNDNSAVNKLGKSLDEFCNIKEKSVDEKCQIKEKSTVNVEKILEDDNIWEDNDWGDFDQKPSDGTTKLPEPIKNSVNTKESSHEMINVTKKQCNMPNKSSNTNTLDDNLWEDEDDWGKLEKEAKIEPEEDLWGDGDGWGVDTPQETPKKEESTEKISAVQSKMESDENDLWAEGDNWGINDVTDDSKTDAKSALDALTAKDETTWSGWSNWGISSVLSTAANITTSVSQGISTVLESGIGVPDPAELARLHKAEAEQRRREGDESIDHPSEDFVPFGFGNLVPGVSTITKLVETTGTKVITRGLGTLETIGKKTYEVLQENDPQLKKKRALLKLLEADKPVLSSILREAKERAETENKHREVRQFAKKANYETMFDDYTGLVHLEALEMLSKQCDIKLESMLSQSMDVTEMQETMEQIKDLCELNAEEDDEEFSFDELKSKIQEAIDDINIGITCDKVLAVVDEVTEWIERTDSCNKDEIHSNAIENLAKLTAMAVEQYHKAGELLLIKEHRSTADEADSLVQLTTAISALIGFLSTKYTEKLKTCSQTSNEEMRTLISNIYLEAANSSRYVEDAFSLLIPVIQVGAV